MTRLNAGAEIVGLLKEAYRNFKILDASFPLMTFYWYHENRVSISKDEELLSAAERSFYSRFRQSGGHLPIVTLAQILSDLPIPGDNAVGEDVRNILAISVPSLSAHVGQIQVAREYIPVLSYEFDTDVSLLHLEAINTSRNGLLVRLIRDGSAELFFLTDPGSSSDSLITSFVKAAKEFAVAIKISEASEARNFRTLTIELPKFGGQQKLLTMSPRCFVHDGTRSVETAKDYSWLWIGAERYLRIALGVIPSHFIKLRIIVPNAHTTANLRGSKVLLNGERVAHDVEIWAEGSGAVSIELAKTDVAQVLGFAVPMCRGTGTEGSMLAACLDKLEFSA